MHALSGNVKKLSAYVGAHDMYDDKRTLCQALIDQARIQGCAGLTAYRGTVGFGPSSRDITSHGDVMSNDDPVVVTVIDDDSRITALAEVWTSMMSAGLLIIEECEVIHYEPGEE